MKKLLSSLILIGVLALSGCATSPVSRATTGAKLAAYIGTTEYQRAHPETRPAFVIAAEELRDIEQAETIDFVTVLAIVQRLPVDRLRSPRAQLIITATSIILADVGGQVPLDHVESLRPVVKALREGVELGLGPSP